MAGTVTIVERTFGTVKQLKYSWTSDSAGAADGTSTAWVEGEILQMITVPDTTAAPTADYDIVINDTDGIDVLRGAGADRHTANTEYVTDTQTNIVAPSRLTLGVTNAGSAKAGTVYLRVR